MTTKMTAVLRNGERVPNWLAMKAIGLVITVSLGLGGWALKNVAAVEVKQAEDRKVIEMMKERFDRFEKKLDRALGLKDADF